MSMHQCPKCELLFTWHTELDDHCRTDHPDFHHDYPATAPPAAVPPPPATPPDVDAPPAKHLRPNLAGWLQPRESRDHPRRVPPVSEPAAPGTEG